MVPRGREAGGCWRRRSAPSIGPWRSLFSPASCSSSLFFSSLCCGRPLSVSAAFNAGVLLQFWTVLVYQARMGIRDVERTRSARHDSSGISMWQISYIRIGVNNQAMGRHRTDHDGISISNLLCLFVVIVVYQANARNVARGLLRSLCVRYAMAARARTAFNSRGRARRRYRCVSARHNRRLSSNAYAARAAHLGGGDAHTARRKLCKIMPVESGLVNRTSSVRANSLAPRAAGEQPAVARVA